MAAPSYMNRLPIKKFPLTTVPLPLLIHGLIGFFFLYMIFDFGLRFFNFLSSTAQSSAKSKVGPLDSQKTTQNLTSKVVDGSSLGREEVEMVMAKLGIFCQPEGVKLQERLDSADVSDMFVEEEEEASLGDVIRGAFDVFDENKDGFIDESELQRVLCALALNQAAELDNCKKMIMAFDDNGDGKIDFQEFLKLI